MMEQYEEGTWKTILRNLDDAKISYQQAGTYTKIGKIVKIKMTMAMSIVNKEH